MKINEKNKITKILFSIFILLVIGGLFSGDFSLALPGDPVNSDPRQVEVSAHVLSSENNEVKNGKYKIRFAIYSQDRETTDPYPSASDSSLWEEEQEVTIYNGLMRATLGSVVPFPNALNFSSGEYYLGIRIGEDSEMVPRKKINAVPLSINALNLNGATTGLAEGNIPLLETGGKLNRSVLPKITKLGTVTVGTWQAEKIASKFIATALTGKTYNGLTLNSSGSSFSIGSSNDLQLVVSGGSLNLNQSLDTTATPDFSGLCLDGDCKGSWSEVSGNVYTAAANNLLQLSGTEFSLKQGVMTDEKICTFSAINGLTCTTDPGAAAIAIGSSITGSPSAGSVLFIDDENKLAQDNANFYWDENNHRLGIGTALPGFSLDVNGVIQSTGYRVNSETVTDWSGTGITVSGGALTSTLGTAIDGTELSIASQAQGDVLYFNGTNWVRLAAGTNGYFLKTQGAGANPIWDQATGTTYSASGTLLDLTGTTFSVNEGTLTDGKICVYTAGVGLVCNTDAGAVGATYTAGNDLDLVGTQFDIESQLDYVSVINRTSADLTLQTTTSGNIILSPAGNVGIGTTAPGYKLEVNGVARFEDGIISGINSTDIYGNNFPEDFSAAKNLFWITNPSVAVENLIYASMDIKDGVNHSYPATGTFRLQTSAASTGSLGNYAYGLVGSVSHEGSGAFNNIYGGSFSSYSQRSNSPTGNLYGIEVQGNVFGGTVSKTYGSANWAWVYGGTATNAYGVFASAGRDGGTLTNAYGVYIDSVYGASRNFQLYSAGTSPSYFAGNVGIGTTLPSFALDVNGDIRAQGGELYLTGISSSASTTEGTMYYDNDDDNLYVYANGGWVDLTQQDTNTTYTASGTLLNLSSTTFSVNEGTLTDGKICVYTAGVGLVCNTDAGAVGATYTAGNDLDLSGTQFDIESQLDYVSTINRTSANLTLQTTTSGNIILNPAGNVGIGTTAPAAKLDVNTSLSATSGFITRGTVSALTTSPTSNSTAYTISNYASNFTPVALGFNYGNIVGFYGDAENLSNRNGASIIGSEGYAKSNGGTVSSGVFGASGDAVFVGGAASWLAGLTTWNGSYGGTVQNQAGLYISGVDIDGSSVTNRYGIYIPAFIGVATNDFSFFSGATQKSYFAGNVGIGTTLPSFALDVNGDVRVQGGELYLTGIASSASTTEGTMYYDNDDDNLYVYANGGWVDLTQQDTDTNTIYTAGNDLDLSGTQFDIESQLDYVSTISRASSNLTLQTTTSGNIILNPVGNVGIGTTDPAAKLAVSDGSIRILNGNFDVMEDDNGNAAMSVSASNTTAALQLRNSGSTTIQLHGDSGTASYFVGGNVGIGTTSPGRGLEVYGGTSADGYVRITGGEGYSSILELYADQGDDNADKWDFLSNASDNRLSIRNNTSNLMSVLSGGNVGIGTTSPQYKFQLQGAADPWNFGGMFMSPVTSSGSGWNSLGGNGGTGFMFYGTAYNKPYGTAQLNLGANSTINFLVGNGDVAPSSVMYINSSGNVGIGTTNPDKLLNVYGNVNGEVALKIQNANTGGSVRARLLLSSGTDSALIGLNEQGAGTGLIIQNVTQDRPIIFYTNAGGSNAERMRINYNGNVGIGTTSPVATLDVGGWAGIPSPMGGGTYMANVAGDIFAGITGAGVGRYRMSSNTTRGFISWNSYWDGSALKAMDTAKSSWLLNLDGGADVFQIQRAAATAGTQTFSSLFTLNSSGNVGIGTTAPLGLLHVNSGTANTVASFESSDPDAVIKFVDNGGQSSIGTTGGNVRLDAGNEGNIELYILSSTGNVGIGTTAPAQKLEVTAGSGSQLRLSYDPVKYADFQVDASGNITVTTTGSSVTFSGDTVSATTFSGSGASLTDIAETSITDGSVLARVAGSETISGAWQFSNEPTLTGSGRHARKIQFNAEYSGAVLSTFYGGGTDTSITGTMNSDAEPSADNLRTYYEWNSSEASLNYYTVAIRVTLPQDFDGWATSDAIQVDIDTESTAATDNLVDVYIYNGDDTPGSAVVSSTGNKSSVADTWTTVTIDDSSIDDGGAPDWDAPGETAVIYLRLGSKSDNFSRIGDVKFNYLSKW